MSEEKEQEQTLEEPVVDDETLTVADMPPDLGNPSVADFPDPAWDDTTDEEGETPEPDEPDDEEDDEEEELEDEEEEAPTVPPGILEDQIEQALEDPDEPDDYDPEE